MPKVVNRPRDSADAQQMQQGPLEFGEQPVGEQMGEAESPDDSAEQQSPA